MDYKICTRCGEEKEVSLFGIEKRAVDGKTSACKSCLYKSKRIWEKKNRERLVEYSRKWRRTHPKRAKELTKNWREKNKEKMLSFSKLWNEKFPEKRKNINRRSGNKKYKTLRGCLNIHIATSMRKSLRGNKHGSHWESLVNYTVDDLKNHIERQFKDGMSWDNRHLWHIDHIITISAFNYEKAEDYDFKRCWALDNLQPLWASDNIKKKDKLLKPFQPSLLRCT